MEDVGGIRRRRMSQYFSSSRVLLVALGLVLSSRALPDALSEDAHFDIPAQSVRSALIEFSRQADVQVMGSSSSFGDLQSNGIKGKLRSREALALLLQNTGLKYEAVKHAVVVRSDDKAQGAASSMQEGRALKIGETKDSSPGKDGANGDHERDDDLLPLGSMTVTGTHIRGGSPVGSQLIVMDRRAIAKTGYATVQDVVRSLPQVFGGGASEDTVLGTEAGTNTARSSGLNLRGLGSGSTLVLINGRRLAMGGTQSSFVDVSSIPLSAVSRIEVMTDGASAIYGSDAVGGVVNFIMRDDYEGAETQGRFGAVTDGAVQETDVSQLLGARWTGGHATLSYEFYHRDALAYADRERTADSDLRRFGGSNFSSRQSNPGTLLIGNQVYAVPRNQNGMELTPGSFTPGTFNLQNQNENRDLLPEQQRHSGFLTMSQSITDAVTLFGDALYSQRHVQARNPGLAERLTVPVSNPFRVLPAGASATDAYRVQYNFGDDLGPRVIEADVKTLESSFAARMELPNYWEVTGSVSYSMEGVRQEQGGAVNEVALAAALADPNPLTAFNPFGDGSFTNPETLERIRSSTMFSSDSDVKGMNLLANGALFALPAGKVRLAAGVDRREQTFQTQRRNANALGITSSPRYRRNVSAAFAEVLVPVVSGDMHVPGMEQLQLSLAGRYDDYSDVGTTLNPRFGLEWTFGSGLSLHGNWGKSFMAPNLPDMDESTNMSYITEIPDPQAADGQSPVLAWLGGNAELKAETANTWRVGMKWAPENAVNAMLDLSYFNISFQDRIQAPPLNGGYLNDPVRYAGIITRNPTVAQRDAVCSRGAFAGSAGGESNDCLYAPIVAIIDTRSNNTSISTTRGMDLNGSLDVESKWGRLELSTNITYLLDFSEAQTPTVAALSYLDTVGNPLRFRMREGISWSREGWGAHAFVNYAGGYSDMVSAPARKVGSWTTMDLTLSYDVDPMNTSWLAGCSVALSVQNLFDTDPPFVNYTGGVGYDRENADLLQRFVGLRLKKEW